MSRERILVVDDSREIRDFIKDAILKPNGFAALTARDGMECLEKVRAQQPDLILLDLQMPRMDGLQVLDALNTAHFEIPVILMTAHGSEAIAVEVFRKGVRDYIIKGDNFAPQEILGAIERSLSEVRLRREKEQLYDDLIMSNADLKHRFQELKVLYHVGRSVTALLDLNSLMQRIVGAATMLTASEEGAAFILENGQLMCRALKRQGDERPYAVNTPMAEPMAVHSIETAQMVSFNPDNVVAAGRGNGKASSAKVMATPMIYGGQTIGALLVKNVSAESAAFSDHHGALLSALADYAAIAFKTQGQVKSDDLLLTPPIVKPKSIFISYRRGDYDEYVRPLVATLTDNGLNVWIDQSSLEGGQEWLEKVTHALDECSALVLCVSPEALQSRWVRMEYRYFILEEKPIIPVICKPARLPADLAGLHSLRYAETSKVIERLLLMLKP